ncbi:hypothetical protein Tco_1390819 [Tanacetum coccineum]
MVLFTTPDSFPTATPIPSVITTTITTLPVLSAPSPSPIRSLGYRAAMIRMRAEAAATSHSPPLPPPLILSPTRPDAPHPGPHSSTSFTTIVIPSDCRAPISTDTELGAYVREFESMVRRDTYEIYTRLDDEQSQRQLLAGQVNMLFRDRRAHAHTPYLMETEARLSREAWGRSMDATDRSRQRAILDLLETDHGRREEIRELRAADRARQQLIVLDSSRLFRTLELDRLLHYRDIRDPLGVLHSQSCQRRLVAVLRLDFVMASHFICLLSIRVSIPASKALARDATRNGVDSHTSGTGVRGSERVALDSALQDFH